MRLCDKKMPIGEELMTLDDQEEERKSNNQFKTRSLRMGSTTGLPSTSVQ